MIAEFCHLLTEKLSAGSHGMYANIHSAIQASETNCWSQFAYHIGAKVQNMCVCTCGCSHGTRWNTCTHIFHADSTIDVHMCALVHECMFTRMLCLRSVCRGVEASRKLPREKRKFTQEEKRIIYHKLAHTECIPKNKSAICQIFNGSCYSRSGPDELWKKCKWAGKMGLKNYVLSLFTFKCRTSSTWWGRGGGVARKASWLCFSIKSSISIMYCLNRNSLALAKKPPTASHLRRSRHGENGLRTLPWENLRVMSPAAPQP